MILGLTGIVTVEKLLQADHLRSIGRRLFNPISRGREDLRTITGIAVDGSHLNEA